MTHKPYPYTQADETPEIDALANEWGAIQEDLAIMKQQPELYRVEIAASMKRGCEIVLRLMEIS